MSYLAWRRGQTTDIPMCSDTHRIQRLLWLASASAIIEDAVVLYDSPIEYPQVECPA
jgi:hypothetical protein